MASRLQMPDRALAALLSLSTVLAAQVDGARLDLVFEKPARIADAAPFDFVARGPRYEVGLEPGRLLVAMLGKDGGLRAVRLCVRGSSRSPLRGEAARASRTNVLRGNDPAQWQVGVPHYGRVRQAGVLPGVDVVYYGKAGELEYDFELAPGSDPAQLVLDVEGVDSLHLEADGALVLRRGEELLRKAPPVAWVQRGAERERVACRYRVLGARAFGFALDAYDRAGTLVIDPVITYASFLGASAGDECLDVAVDGSGNAFLVGWTVSTAFPVVNALQGNLRSTYDAWVAKVDPTGSTLLFSTYLGGTGAWNDYEAGLEIDVDGNGQPVILGRTSATDFPVTPGAWQPTLKGNYDAFVTKLTSNGQGLAWSTYLGGSGFEVAWKNSPNITLGADLVAGVGGLTYVTGTTDSSDFPVRNALQPVHGGGVDAFLAVFDPVGQLLTATYLGGTNDDYARRLHTNATGEVLLGGSTASPNFPVTPSAVFTSGPGFVTKLNLTATGILWSTRFPEVPIALAADAQGFPYAAGSTRNSAFPVTEGAFQRVYSGASDQSKHGDGWITKLSPFGTSLVWSTLLGTFNSPDAVVDLVLDGRAQPYLLLNGDAVAGRDVGGTQLVLLAEEGGGVCWEKTIASRSEGGIGMALGANGTLWACGTTSSPSGIAPTTNAFQRVFGGMRDGWVVRTDDAYNGLSSLAVAAKVLTHFGTTTGTVTLDGLAPAGGVTIPLSTSPTGLLAIPASVTIPQGAASATFPIQLAAVPRGTVTVIAGTFRVPILLSPGPTYRVVDLGAAPGGPAATAVAINRTSYSTGGGSGSGGYVHHDTTGNVPLQAAGIDINAVNQVLTSGPGYQQVSLYTPSQGYANVPLFAGATGGLGQGLNDLGWVVGSAYVQLGYSRAFLARPGQVTLNLGTLGGSASTAYDVNNKGQVVGEAFVPSNSYEPFVWDASGGLRSLGLLPTHTYGRAYAINDAGEVAGVSAGPTTSRAFVLRNGVLQDQGVLTGDVRSLANDLNQHGQAVGTSSGSNNAPRAVLFTVTGGIELLEDLVSPEDQRVWDLRVAYGINDLGQIVGEGYTIGATATAKAFRLDPLGVAPYGDACMGKGTTLPALAGEKLPISGASFGLRIAGGTNTSALALAFAAQAAQVQLPDGCWLHLLSLDVVVPLPVDPAGRGRLDLNVPPGLPNGRLHAQAVYFDLVSGFAKLSTTNGVQIEVR